ncbi:hypothetical protein J2X66_002736 [Pseudomonas sp. 3296]|nr:hypothetical protein [Pseudomonas sp. 3296]
MTHHHCRVFASDLLRSSNPDICHASPAACVRF